MVDGVRWVATLQRMRRDKAKDYGVPGEDADRYLRLEIPKSNYTPPFAGLWLRREAGGVMVPCELTEQRESRQREKDEARYLDVVGRIQRLLHDGGPLTRRQLRQHAGTSGRLAAGDHSVRSIIERAVSDGSLVQRAEGADTLLLPPTRDGGE
jgi:hypothetical protein